MPELVCAGRSWTIAAGSNLLDALNAAGLRVPYSCRAGSCQACMVRCRGGEPLDARPEALPATQREQGWRLACQCRIDGDLQVELFDPARDGLAAQVQAVDVACGATCCACACCPSGRCATAPASTCCCGRRTASRDPTHWRACRTTIAGWNSTSTVTARAPSARRRAACAPAMACGWGSCTVARCTTIRTGQSARCCCLPAVRAWRRCGRCCARRCATGHVGPIRLLHRTHGTSYLAEPLLQLAQQHDLDVQWLDADQSWNDQVLRIASRQEIALVCGYADFVAACCRRRVSGRPGRADRCSATPSSSGM